MPYDTSSVYVNAVVGSSKIWEDNLILVLVILKVHIKHKRTVKLQFNIEMNQLHTMYRCVTCAYMVQCGYNDYHQSW